MPSTWPSDLPQTLQVSDYSETFPDGLLRSDNDVGPASVRRRTSGAVAPLAGSVLMSEDQCASLRTFVVTTLIGGSLAFYLPDPHGGGSPLLVRFAGQPVITPYAGVGPLQWQATLKMEILP